MSTPPPPHTHTPIVVYHTLHHQSNRELASSEKVCLLLLTLFDPREQCTPVQVLATRVFLRVVYVLHTSVAEVGGAKGGARGEGVRLDWIAAGTDWSGLNHDVGDFSQHSLSPPPPGPADQPLHAHGHHAAR